MNRTYGYSRVSTLRQANQGVSLEAQEEQLKKYHAFALAPKGYVWAGQFRDSAQSGKKHLLERPAGKELSQVLEPGDAVVISRLDRGFRNLKDLLNTLDTWKTRRVSVHLLDLNIDTSNEIGRLIVSVLGAVAEFESAWRIERVRLALDHLKKQGYHTTGLPPYGFKTVGPRGARRLITDRPLRAIGKMIVGWRDEGWPWPKIYLHLFKTKIRYRDREVSEMNCRRWDKGERDLMKKEAAKSAGAPNGTATHPIAQSASEKPTCSAAVPPSANGDRAAPENSASG
jgi:DNA invertase Pin-like site-specific DNA recombinase